MKGIKFKIFFVSFCICLTVAIVLLANIAVTNGQEDNSTKNTETTNREETQNTTIENTENTTTKTEENTQQSTNPTENETTSKPTEEMTISEILKPDQTNVEHPGITENSYKNRIKYFSDIFPTDKKKHEIKNMDLYFVGDSIMEDWAAYKYHSEKVFYSSGVDTYKITRQNLVEQPDGVKITIPEAICKAKPKILIIMLGSNDVEWMEGTKFTTYYNKFLNEVEKASPDTTIYLQSITPIRNSKSNEWYNNARVNYFNLLIANIAKKREYKYIDIAEHLKDSDGQLKQEFNGGDGIHLSPSAYNIWMDYYKTHI